MKRLTLDQTWTEQLKMSAWVVVARNKRKFELFTTSDIKRYYLKHIRRTKADLKFNCYFCEYNKQQGGVFQSHEEGVCSNCPGRLAQCKFHCCRTKYWYYDNPAAFLRKLEQLNRKRKKK